MADCPHADQEHTIWYWIDDPSDPVPTPYALAVDNHADARGAIDRLMAQPAVRWAKAFRHDNEFYRCIKEQKPPKEDDPWLNVSDMEHEQPPTWWERFKDWLGL